MNILLVGGAGYVASIIRPALEREHHVRFFDRVPVPGAEERSTVGDVNDEAAIKSALHGIQSVVYLAMGIRPGTVKDAGETKAAFDVNCQALFRWLDLSMRAGVRNFVFSSSMSVYTAVSRDHGVIDEETPADGWWVYAMTKRCAELICHGASQQWPDATIVSLRLMWPLNETDWLDPKKNARSRTWHPTGPNDIRRLYSAAVNCRTPGDHVLNCTGDTEGAVFPYARSMEVIGWRPMGG
ncbi:MAG: NAD(P)-dependent oxidoreductase [Planctomycetes bacterium]|nr:NAD(P)-dependent oxidoreductase [Planctomycetota bacterium]